MSQPKLKWKRHNACVWYAKCGSLELCVYNPSDRWMGCADYSDELVMESREVSTSSDPVDAMVACEAAVKERLMSEFWELLR